MTHRFGEPPEIPLRPPVRRAFLGEHCVELREVGEERVLAVDRFADTIDPHGALVDASRDPK